MTVDEVDMDELAGGFAKQNVEPKVDVLGNEIVQRTTPELPELPDLPSEDTSSKKPKEDVEGDREEEVENVDGADEIPLEFIKPLKDGQQIVSKLPKELEFLDSELDLYPQHLNDVYNYRHAAYPVGEEIQVKSKTPRITEPKYVGITFNDIPLHAGSLAGPKDGGEDLRVIKFYWIQHSQVPGFKLAITRGNGTIVTVTFFANHIARQLTKDGQRNVFFDMAIETDNIAHPRINPKVNDKSSIIKISVRRHDGSSRQPAFGPQCTRVQLNGISREELEMLQDIVDHSESYLDPEVELSHGDWILAALLQSRNFTIFRPWQNNKESFEVFNKFKGFFQGAMVDCVLNGNWPHYRRQAPTQSINDMAFPIAETVPPRDMVRRWRVTVKDGKAGSVAANTWWPFTRLESYPDPETKAFALRLATERDRDFSQAALQEQLDSRNGSLGASISPFPRSDAKYWIEISGDRVDGRIFKGHASKPALGSRLSITIVDGDFKDLRFKGSVAEDAFGSQAEITAVCTLSFADAKKFKVAKAATLNTKVTVDLISDGTSSNRQNAAICEIGRPLVRTEGVDIPALVLNSPAQIINTDALWQQIKGSEEAIAAFWEVINTYHLNDDQKDAAMKSLQSLSGAMTVHGPPGTGKTMTSLVIALGHIIAGRVFKTPRKVLITAPSNAAVANALRVMIRLLERAPGTKIRMCLFKGSTIKGGRPKTNSTRGPLAEASHSARAADGEDGVEPGELTVDDVWEWVEQYMGTTNKDKDIAPYYFSQQRLNLIHDVAQDSTHPWQGNAKYLFQENRNWRDKTASEDAKKQARSNLDLEEHVWDKRFLQECDIVLCTNSSAAHEMLMEYWRPSIVIMDEAALSSLPDAATPLAAFKESLRHIILAGDHKQQGAPTLSKGASETYTEAAHSLFDQLQSSAEGTCDKVMLKLQHRMKDSFSRMVSEVWYDGKLQDHTSLANESALERTIKKGLRNLGKPWTGRMRIGVDVSGGDVFHEKDDGSPSLINREEAAMLVSHVQWLLSLVPPQNGRRVTPADILVISPYGGQMVELRKRLAANGIRDVTVMNSAMVQGSERNIVLLSVVRNLPNEPDSLGFVSESKQACVNFSRVKEYMVTFGNFIEWMQATRNPDSKLGQNTSGKQRDFAKVVKDHNARDDLFTRKQLQDLHNALPANEEHAITKYLQAPQAPAAAGQMRQPVNLGHFARFEEVDQHKRKRKRKKQGDRDGGVAEGDGDGMDTGA